MEAVPRRRGRIIPARAGFTPARSRPAGWRGDHPRSRGVYTMGATTPSASPGSSPLARGLREAGHPRRRLPRIIPARAGFTCRTSSPSCASRDHPRSRGVYSTYSWLPTLSGGSSPLARGLRDKEGGDTIVVGIIPARAGFTFPRSRRRLRSRDHPRSRGVYTAVTECDRKYSGSSPLARGLLYDSPDDGCAHGIIPARAGFTGRRVRVLRPGPDHPRSRGVYSPRPHPHYPPNGSSPLARGLRLHGDPALLRCRIIPARAGFTP